MTKRTVVAYHADCPDGFCAAWIAFQHFGVAADYVAVRYQEPPPPELLAAKEVYLLDFSYPLAVLASLPGGLVLDHHKTAAAALAGWPPGGPMRVTFDQERSGARLAYDEWPVPEFEWLVNYVQDRDLWRHALPHSAKVSAALRAVAPDFGAWTYFASRGLEAVLDDGVIVLAYEEEVIHRALGRAAEAFLGGYFVPVVNLTTCISETLNLLCRGRPFAASWFKDRDGCYVYSLRSDADGIDVSKVAQKFGGGGHARAAGMLALSEMHDSVVRDHIARGGQIIGKRKDGAP